MAGKFQSAVVKIIAESIADGTPPWRSEANRGAPADPVTGRSHAAVNSVILDAAADRRSFRSRFWATPRQWKSLGLQVSKRQPGQAEYGTTVFSGGDVGEKYEVLFNADQCFGRNAGPYLILEGAAKPAPDYRAAESLVAATRSVIVHHSSVRMPRYDRPPEDRILMPPRSRFLNDSQYFSTLFHELAHYSEWRIGWVGRSEEQGELLAEIVTGLLESELGLPHDTDRTNQNKWSEAWISGMAEHPSYFFDAARYAASSVEWVFGFGQRAVKVPA